MSSTISGEAPDRGVRITRISSASGSPPAWTLAVFAHNESGRIRAALESIGAASAGEPVEVFVLANGCTDATAEEVRACGHLLANLSLVEIDVADKANAWNVYLHDVIIAERARHIDAYFFMDGDVTIEPGAFLLLAAAFRDQPSAWAAGGMPASGRDREAWRARMVANGTIAGNLYALRNTFVDRIRAERLRMPVGLIGEDLFLSWLVGSGAIEVDRVDGPRCIFCANAQFSFRSLSVLRPGDYRAYLRRKWRYTYRALQLEMLLNVLRKHGLAAMPAHVNELYESAPLPSRLKWVGLDSPMRLLAVLQIRSFRK
jgi:glycosyltransferase involved in cell wall biosynthesis